MMQHRRLKKIFLRSSGIGNAVSRNNFSCAVRESHQVCKNFRGSITQFARSWLRPWMSLYKWHKLKMTFYTNSSYGIYPKIRPHEWVNKNARPIAKEVQPSSLRWWTAQHRILRKPGSLRQSTLQHAIWFVRRKSSACRTKTCKRFLRHTAVYWVDCAALCMFKAP